MKSALALSGVLLLAVACGPKSSKTTADPGPGNGGGDAVSDMSCEDVAEKLGGQMESAGEFGPEDVKFMMDALIGSCERTAWSADAKTCFANATGGDQAETCQGSLTDEQAADFRQAMGMEGGE